MRPKIAVVRFVTMRNVLVAVLGSTPAILTEAIYYYARIAEPPVMFSEVHVYTTTMGRDLVFNKLLGTGNGKGHYFELLDKLGLRPTSIDFGENHVHVLAGRNGWELVDVRTREDSLAVADQLCAAIQDLRKPDTRIYATMAGGRKTVGIYLTMAMQLLARPGDRLFHVLPDPRIEANPQLEFFFPDKPLVFGGQTVQPEDLRIECDEVPLLYWPWEPGGKPERLSFSALQEQRQRELRLLYQPPQVSLDAARRKVTVADQSLKLTKLEFFYYFFFARRTKQLGAEAAAISLKGIADAWAEITSAKPYPKRCAGPVLSEMTQRGDQCASALMELEQLFYRLLPPTEGRDTDFATRMRTDFKYEPGAAVVPLSSTISRLNGKIADVLKPELAKQYSICKAKARGDNRYAIWLPPERITIVEKTPSTSSARK